MVDIFSLWLPILVSAVFVFIVSSLMHIVLPHHKHDFEKLPDEDKALDALGGLSIPPGEYMFPSTGGDMAAMRSEEFKDKMKKGPVGMLTIFPPSDDPMSMAPQLTQWFVFCILVSVFAAYIAGRALEPGADYLLVQRFAGATAFIAYTLGDWPRSIWYRQAWSTTVKNTIDGLIYGLVTGGTFGWLWPS